jgi:hypothetical protein
MIPITVGLHRPKKRILLLKTCCMLSTSSRCLMMRYHLSIAVLLVLAACQLGSTSAAVPIRATWIKDPSQPHPHGEVPTHSENPLLKWWTGLTGHHTKKTDSKPECMWLEYPRHDALKAWEIQAAPRRHVVRRAVTLLPAPAWSHPPAVQSTTNMHRCMPAFQAHGRVNVLNLLRSENTRLFEPLPTPLADA